MKNIGWIGLGKMGLPMALKLASQKHKLSVFNRTKSKTSDLVAAGASAEDNVASVAKKSDITITMVSDDFALERIALGSDGVLKNAKPNSTFIFCGEEGKTWHSYESDQNTNRITFNLFIMKYRKKVVFYTN